MKWTTHQQLAISAPIGNILVNAGAGSGKTAVLTERVVQRLLEGHSLSQLLIVTFTKKAALEMKERIRHRLLKLSKDHPALLTQLALLDSASISTIDSFAGQIVSQFGYLKQLPAKTAIIDQVMLIKHKHRILDELIEEWFSTPYEPFIFYVSHLTIRHDHSVRQQLLDLDELIRQYNDQLDYFTELKERFHSESYKEGMKVAFESLLKEFANQVLESVDTLNRHPQLEPHSEYLTKLNDHYDSLSSCQTIDDYQEFFGQRVPSLVKPKWLKELEIQDVIETVDFVELEEEAFITSEQFAEIQSYLFIKNYRKYNIEHAQKKLKEHLEQSWTEIIAQYDALLTYQTILVDLTLVFRERVNQWFYDQGWMDYQSMANTALSLIREFPEVQQEYRNRFVEVFVDEYQDTSLFQDELLTSVSHQNLFCVGDIKQSIYRFRQANPQLFLAKQQAFLDDPKGTVIQMNENFRSHPFVIRDINALFGSIMSIQRGGVTYDASQMLIAANPKYQSDNQMEPQRGFVFVSPIIPETHRMDVVIETEDQTDLITMDDLHGDGPTWDIDAFEEDYSPSADQRSFEFKVDWEADCLVIIQDIKEKVDQGYMIHGDDGLRPAKYDDFVILMDRRRYFKQLQVMFDYHDLPAYFHYTEMFIQTHEIQAVKNLLRLIYSFTDNNYFVQTFRHNFASVARSFLLELPDEELHMYLHTLKTAKTTSIEDVVALATHTSSEFLASVQSLAQTLASHTIYDVLSKVYDTFHVFERSLKLYDTERVEKRLLFMLEKARVFSDVGMQIHDFIDYFDFVVSQERNDLDIEFMETSELEQGKVNIMTMHAAKGLEFPIVYYPNLEMRVPLFNQRSVEFSPQIGLISPGFDEGIYYPITKKLFRDALKKEDISERLRLLYVALTRAKELAVIFIKSTPESNNRLLAAPTKKQGLIQNMESFFEDLNIPVMFRDVSYVGLSEAMLENYKVPKPQEASQRELDQRKFDYKLRDVPPPQPMRSLTGSSQIATLLTPEQLSAVNYGNYLHDLLSFVDYRQPLAPQFKRLNLKQDEQRHIQRFAACSLMSDSQGATMYHEYRFFQLSDAGPINGIIDLLIVGPDICRIIDFKLKNIDQPHYENQVRIYMNYIQNVLDRPVQGYLYSIITGDMKQILLG